MEEIGNSQMLVVMHKHPCKEKELFDMRVQLHRKNMKYLWYSHRVSFFSCRVWGLYILKRILQTTYTIEMKIFSMMVTVWMCYWDNYTNFFQLSLLIVKFYSPKLKSCNIFKLIQLIISKGACTLWAVLQAGKQTGSKACTITRVIYESVHTVSRQQCQQ